MPHNRPAAGTGRARTGPRDARTAGCGNRRRRAVAGMSAGEAAAYRQMEHTSAGMQEGAASPFLCHPQRQTPLGRLGGPKPSECNPNPATCAAGSEILRSKGSLHVSPAAPPGAGKTCPGGKGRQRRPFSTSRSGCKPLPLSCSGRALRAQEHDVPFAARLRNSLAAKL